MGIVSKEEILASLEQSKRSKAVFEWMQELKKRLDGYLENLSHPDFDKKTEWQKIENQKTIINQLLNEQSDNQLWCHTELCRFGLILSWKICVLSEKDTEFYERVFIC